MCVVCCEVCGVWCVLCGVWVCVCVRVCACVCVCVRVCGVCVCERCSDYASRKVAFTMFKNSFRLCGRKVAQVSAQGSGQGFF